MLLGIGSVTIVPASAMPPTTLISSAVMTPLFWLTIADGSDELTRTDPDVTVMLPLPELRSVVPLGAMTAKPNFGTSHVPFATARALIGILPEPKIRLK